MNEDIGRTRQILNVGPLKVALLFWVIVGTLSLGALLESLVYLIGPLHTLLAVGRHQLVVLLDDDLDRCALVVVDEIVHLPALAQVVASGEPGVDVHLGVGVLVEVLAQARLGGDLGVVLEVVEHLAALEACTRVVGGLVLEVKLDIVNIAAPLVPDPAVIPVLGSPLHRSS